MNISDPQIIADVLKSDGIVVIRTDTLYGIIASAASEKGVEAVYAAKSRNPAKQCIILVSNPSDVPPYAEFINEYSAQSEQPTSVIVPASAEPSWILRGGNTIAYRVVRDPLLRQVVDLAGPVIAPSANPEGLPPAATIEIARGYFGDAVDLYVDGGEVPSDVQASRIIQVSEDRTVAEIRA